MRNRTRRGLLLGVAVLLLLPGCGDTYSDAITYELRQDPFFKEKAPTLPVDSDSEAAPFLRRRNHLAMVRL